ncbi:hypothetical protein DFA_05599 [Cavenderia fasciculata]|uniref:Uncharacterized protein n=1 Tax=Cavenderia fasciculata TaxID=261658 RepID=F4PLP4_CACFS|nr:uncharacterized protein DFA_05599 [Cavenderia fasciculata]EGG23466.1 hypothetical protein DFA_05599 [Cavenderia fasciculata]|eukprot:XP_004361317.1 hypothetical protein DFA_05599 [Cavenderia fasciculata]
MAINSCCLLLVIVSVIWSTNSLCASYNIDPIEYEESPTSHWTMNGIAYVGGKLCNNIPLTHMTAHNAIDTIVFTGANWIQLVVTQYQKNINSTFIYPTNDTDTDDEFISAISYAGMRDLGIMISPRLELEDDPGRTPEEIGTFFREADWVDWFGNYSQMVFHYASMLGDVPILVSLGSGLEATSWRDAEWRNLTKKARDKYPRWSLTYSANSCGEESNITWWDAVDFIGVNAHYNIPRYGHDSYRDYKFVDNQIKFWNNIVYVGRSFEPGCYMTKSLFDLKNKYNKPILFTEIGFCSGLQQGRKCLNQSIDLQFQDASFKAFFRVFLLQDWFYGAFIWHWVPDPNIGGPEDWNYTPRRKPAENVVKYHYGGFGFATEFTHGHILHCNTSSLI